METLGRGLRGGVEVPDWTDQGSVRGLFARGAVVEEGRVV